jgi:transposase
VPHPLVGTELEARITDALVEVLHRGQRVACHARSSRRGGFTTLDEHMPAAHRAHKQWTPERLVHWGNSIGANTGHFVAQLMRRFRHPEHGYRSCLGLLSLTKRYGPQRVEAACTLALELGAAHYRHVRDILTNGRDLIKRAAPEPQWVAPEHANLRGPANYQ